MCQGWFIIHTAPLTVLNLDLSLLLDSLTFANLCTVSQTSYLTFHFHSCNKGIHYLPYLDASTATCQQLTAIFFFCLWPAVRVWAPAPPADFSRSAGRWWPWRVWEDERWQQSPSSGVRAAAAGFRSLVWSFCWCGDAGTSCRCAVEAPCWCGGYAGMPSPAQRKFEGIR